LRLGEDLSVGVQLEAFRRVGQRSACGTARTRWWVSNNRVVTVSWITAFLDTPATSRVDADGFWLVVTATRPSARRGRERQFATLLPQDGDAFIRAQVIESALPGVHLDLHVLNTGEAAQHAALLNAAFVADHGTLVVLTSPGGLPFCLVVHRDEHVRPTPAIRPGGHRSLVDQVCLDVPSSEFELEASFWSSLTGWPRRQGARPEFDYLDRPATLPLRLLLQCVDRDGGPCVLISIWPVPTPLQRVHATKRSAAPSCDAPRRGRRCAIPPDATTASPRAIRSLATSL